ncbi:hypothetical protein XI09_41005 [Bradyrhizobium sp. CCBAU 11386]|uniref:hypothetical protein n=1 Tax=Bradyrhizobium sp. CCBAU 11386 TaxID=1630837 RepID=UPI0023045DD0|nr:hypothetical protein [Bradyrhizobium sp. CCBAU 11386]MDA9510930.1 hypothetical protein [Bradyrhizobium sp. CCBAU 11386]
MKAEFPYWPAALRLDQAAAYCGLSVPTFSAVCPVKPIEFTQSSRGQRYLRARLDAWLASLDKNDPETGSVRRRFGDMLGKSSQPITRRRRRDQT